MLSPNRAELGQLSPSDLKLWWSDRIRSTPEEAILELAIAAATEVERRVANRTPSDLEIWTAGELVAGRVVDRTPRGGVFHLAGSALAAVLRGEQAHVLLAGDHAVRRVKRELSERMGLLGAEVASLAGSADSGCDDISQVVLADIVVTTPEDVCSAFLRDHLWGGVGDPLSITTASAVVLDVDVFLLDNARLRVFVYSDTGVLARMPIGDYLMSYDKLCGETSVTLSPEDSQEILGRYAVSVSRYPDNVTCVDPARLGFLDPNARLHALARDLRGKQDAGLPTVVGGDSESIESASSLLRAEGVEHVMAGEGYDGAPSRVWDRAGEPGQVTLIPRDAAQHWWPSRSIGDASPINVWLLGYSESSRSDERVCALARSGTSSNGRCVIATTQDGPLERQLASWASRAVDRLVYRGRRRNRGLPIGRFLTRMIADFQARAASESRVKRRNGQSFDAIERDLRDRMYAERAQVLAMVDASLWGESLLRRVAAHADAVPGSRSRLLEATRRDGAGLPTSGDGQSIDGVVLGAWRARVDGLNESDLAAHVRTAALGSMDRGWRELLALLDDLWSDLGSGSQVELILRYRQRAEEAYAQMWDEHDLRVAEALVTSE